VELLANRVVYGPRSTPYAVLAGFSRRVGSALSVDEVLPRMAEAAARGVGATRSLVRVIVPGGTDQAVAWPPDALTAGYDLAVPVLHHGVQVGEIALRLPSGETLSPAERALLDDLATQAGPAFANVRLTEELRASRGRIVAAQDAERRRIERDLHDGAQQYLVALSVNLKVARELVEYDASAALELLSEVQDQATDALATLRDLARGIYPPALADRGIVAALEAHLAKARGTRPAFEVEMPSADARFASEVEAAAYFCVLEALQNCAKHAPLAEVRVRLAVQDGELRFSVTDSGPGFAVDGTYSGSGLQGMADRLAALGGLLEVQSEPGRGTTVTGRLRAPRR
jgi:signal transduction histidine kinase